MGLFTRRPRSFYVALFLLNATGIVWIHHDLTSGPVPRLRILTALPARDVDSADRFSLVFDEPVAAAGMVGSPLTDSPFVIAPAIAGQWAWAAADKLEFRLDAPLPPGRRFVIKPAASLERLTRRRLIGSGEFKFETRPLRMEKCDLASSDRTHATLEFRFNQPVVPTELVKHLELTDAERARLKDVAVLTQLPATKIQIHASRPASGKLHIHLAKELTGSGGELSMPWDIDEDHEVQPRFALLRSELQDNEFSSRCTVRLRFSRVLDDRQKLPGVKVNPEVTGLVTRISEGELLLEGRFRSGQNYAATVSGNLLDKDGETLGEDQSSSFDVPDRRPWVGFTNGNGILSPQGNLTVDVTAVNVGGMEVRAARVYANNIVGHLRGESRRAVAHEMPAKTIPLHLARNEVSTVALDLRDVLKGSDANQSATSQPDRATTVGSAGGALGSEYAAHATHSQYPMGIYCIQASATDQTWTMGSAIIAITDLGITAKAERNGYLVWVTSLRNATPVAGVMVSAYSYNNQVMATGETNAEGIARLSVTANHPDGPVFALVARHGEDMSYLRPEEQRWRLDDQKDLAGRAAPVNYDVMLYAERGVYRPGDTVHLTGIVRDAQGGTPPPFPLVVEVRRPDDRVMSELLTTPSEGRQGFFQMDYVTHDDGHLGPYKFSVHLPGATEILGQAEALVEEFVPARLELKAESTQKVFGPGESPKFAVTGRYLFGQPAASLPLTFAGQYRHEPIQSARYPEFCFDAPPESTTQAITESEHELDNQGRAEVVLDAPLEATPGRWAGDVSVTLHEEGGRSVSTSVNFVRDTAGRYVGLRLPDGRIVKIDKPVKINWAITGGQDEAIAPIPLSFKLQRVETRTSLQRVDNKYVWKTIEHVVAITDDEIALTQDSNGVGEFAVMCPGSGHYRLDVLDCQLGRTTRIEFDAVETVNTEPVTLTDSPEHLQIRFDRDTYAPGTSARAVIESPFTGQMLVTVESDRVLSTRMVPVSGARTEIDLPVDERIRGGAFVSATLVRPIDPTQNRWLPHRAMGIARLRTDHSARQLPVTLACPQRAEPGEHVVIELRTASPTDPQHPGVAHVWAVDEGILMTTAFKTPDPMAHFFASRKLEVSSADVYDNLMPDFLRPAEMTRIGGDGGDEEEIRRSPVSAPRHEPAVVWQQVISLRPDGGLIVSVDLPRLTGELRVMAVVVDGDRYGSAQRPMTVTSPLLVESSFPRFAAPGDQFVVPVKIFNTTDAPVEASLSAHVDGPLQVDLGSSSTTVRPGEPIVIWARVQAMTMGPVHVRVNAQAPLAGKLNHAESLSDLFVRPAGPLQTDVKIVRVKAGEPLQVPPSDLFVPGTVRTDVTVSANPTVNLRPVVEQLLEYPYGCVEQTTSGLYALLYAPDLIDAENGTQNRVAAIRDMITAGISRLHSMQTRIGGIGYWPGDREPNLWGTTYAAGFLMEAQRAGHTVDAKWVKEIADYLEREMSARRDDAPDDNQRAEICHVLAACGRPDAGWMARLSEKSDQLDKAARAHLAGAWLETGRKDRAIAVLPATTTGAPIKTSTSGRLTSNVQADAVLLRVLLDLDSQHPWIGVIAGRLEAARKAGAWGSTLENAAALAAMAKYQLRSPVAASFQGVIHTPQGDPRPFSSGSTEHVRWNYDLPFSLDSRGQGDLTLCVSRQGLMREAPKKFDRGLKVSRRWTNRQGEAVDPSKLRVGDLVLVETTLLASSKEYDSPVDNIAVVDALPGGMEVENPRLMTSEQGGTEISQADRVEFRDDRLVIFTSAENKKRTFKYALRAITAGSFAWPPIEASCMYDAEYASLHGGGRVEIGK